MMKIIYGAAALCTVAIAVLTVWWHYASASDIDKHRDLSTILMLFGILGGVLYVIFNVKLAQRLENIKPASIYLPSPVIQILSPLPDEHVYEKRKIIGLAWPVQTPVQVLILSKDNQWHPQPAPIFDGGSWSVESTFGLTDSHGSYRVVAIAIKNPIAAPVASLPDGVPMSQIVTVHRQ